MLESKVEMSFPNPIIKDYAKTDIERCDESLQRIKQYYLRKNNTIFDDFWMSDLILFTDLVKTYKKLLEESINETH